MPLHPTLNARERLLLMGSYGSGKSTSWVKIAEWLERTKGEGKVYVLDTDCSAERLIDGSIIQNITWTEPAGWLEAKRTIDQWHPQLTKDDWLVIDSIDKLWEWCQDYFTEQAHGVDAADWFLQYRKDKEGHPLASEYGSNWVVINKLYSTFMGPLQRVPCHVLATSPAEPLSRPETTKSGKEKKGDSPELLDMYGGVGFKPKGQKSLGYQFHTVMMMEKRQSTHAPTRWEMTTVKDRNREEVRGMENKDFVLSYLLKVAGWKL